MGKENIGMLARSKAGHDKECIYIIIDADDTYAYLADGRIRTIDNLKKKKWKHVQLIKTCYKDRDMDNETIRHLLREWNKEETN